MKVIGLRIEKYIDKAVTGHNCDFKYNDVEFEKHVLCCILSNNKKIEIHLSRSEGECGSGWTTANFGHINVVEVKNFNGYEYTPKNIIETDDIFPGFDGDITNNIFSVSFDGGDNYYPSGFYSVNMKLFINNGRAKEYRPVWIFIGKSSLGKSYLANKIQNLEVYETDSSPKLPKKITQSIIVIGNKYQHSLETIKKLIFGKTKIVIVEFSDNE